MGDHVSIIRGGLFGCRNCGGTYEPGEQPVGAWSALATWFEGEHADCEPGGADPHNDWTTADEWARSWDVGISSATIWSVLTGRPSPLGTYDVPRDPGDIGRCFRLLDKLPAWRERLDAVAHRFPKWRPLVDHWDELRALYDEEVASGTAPKLYDRMQALLRTEAPDA